MTESNNPLARRETAPLRAAYVNVNGEMVPTDIDEYCAWLNRKGEKIGWRWSVVTNDDGKRSVTRLA